MRGILAGLAKLLVFYDRRLENVHGLCVKVLLLGCVEIRSMVKDGDIVWSRWRAGIWTSPL